MSYCELHFTLRFLTPAFLGDAEQVGRWRTPPIKHLLREFWRVAYAADKGFNVNLDEMRREEGLLFGNAWLSRRSNGREVTDFSKSLVRLRIDRWSEGSLTKDKWPKDLDVFHREVGNGGKNVGAALYLGYGPLVFSRGTALKAKAAIQAGDEVRLSLAWPESFPAALREALTRSGAPNLWPERIHERLRHALWLADRYGTLGGRGRNGWGSFQLGAAEGDAAPPPNTAPPLRSWRECLNLDWPHAIGSDERGALIWQTAPRDDWPSLMKTLATLKIGLRTHFKFTHGKGAPSPEPRHWLSYPVTKHSVQPWGDNARLPNTLRFKVRPTAEGKLVGVIFHMPHLPPPSFNPDRQAIESVWTQVHRYLDAQGLTRIPA